MLAGKIWGNTRLVFQNCFFEIHRIEVHKDGFCSKHMHEHKFNSFYIENGELEISVWKKDYELTDVTVLKALDQMVVAPGEYHQFKALSAVIAYEIYWVDLDPKDIVRENHGGTVS